MAELNRAYIRRLHSNNSYKYETMIEIDNSVSNMRIVEKYFLMYSCALS